MMAAVFAASIMATGAQGAEKITVDEVANHYPWDGKVDCVTTLSGLETSGYDYKGAFTLSVKKDGAKVSKAVTNDFASVDGTYTNTFDCTTLFGAGLYPNGGIAVDLVKKEIEQLLGGVQLWADGPYWAECNVGATEPEEYGYYFWWGDTVGYTNKGNAWISVKDGSTIAFSNTSPANSTYQRSDSNLSQRGYIDSTTRNLTATHDAATVHLGDPWRMPTSNEIQALDDNCTTEWITTNGVLGRLVTGKGDYATKSIFFPAAGIGSLTSLAQAGVRGYYRSSTPRSSSDNASAWELYFSSDDFKKGSDSCYYGLPVRPVRTK